MTKLQRRAQALKAWQGIIDQSTSKAEAENRYLDLLSAADEMEQEGLITGEEWRKLARKAAHFFIRATKI